MKTRHKKSTQSIFQPMLALAMIIAWFVSATTASAAQIALSSVPLDTQEGIEPNIIVTIDDSGSMGWSFLGNIASDYPTHRAKSSTFNKLYYDPQTTYSPPLNANADPMANSTYTAAWVDGYDHAKGTVDLSSQYRPTWGYRPATLAGYSYPACSTSNPVFCEYTDSDTTPAPGAAYYYVFDTSTCNINSSTDVNNDACYNKVTVSSTSGPGSTDERQNFANWYSYYRTRTMLTKTAAGMAFAKQSNAIRVAYQTINLYTTIGNTYRFEGTKRTDFFNWLYGLPDTPYGTPLRAAFVRAGNKYSQSGINSPYAYDPGVKDLPEYTCRQNFQFAFTDGEWNGSVSGFGNVDNSTFSLPTNSYNVTQYKPLPPYKDSNSNFLGDIALYYWGNDLRSGGSGLANDVKPYIQDSSTTVDYNGDGTKDKQDVFWNSKNDPANWQHMVNFTIGLGVTGTLAYNTTTFDNLVKGTQSWGSNHIDDLWHAAVNSRGEFFSASNPDALITSFNTAIQRITSRTGSTAGPATSLPVYQAGTLLFQPVYDTSNWSGDLTAQDIIQATKNLANPVYTWRAAKQLSAQNYDTGRQIITYNTTTGKGAAFRWTGLSSSEKAALNLDAQGTTDGLGSKRLDYLRGDLANEQRNGGVFRNRVDANSTTNHILGDIVDSVPLYVGPPDRIYPDTMESAPYSAFRAKYKSRKPVIYVGANDGFLHAFDSSTGNELLAFAPSQVYRNLSQLTDPAYQHHYYVDGSPSEGDVFYNSAWHSVLVGGLRSGGQGIYALDVTDPSTFAETNANSTVLWEFTDADDPDLGYTFSRPQIVKMNNGKWVAIFGNGYNNTEADGHASTTGDAVLYIVDISNGSLIAKLDTGAGTAADPLSQGRPNGLSTVTPVDINGDFKVDYIYAGDLFGNLWKFDVSNTSAAKWTVVKQGSIPTPLFVARNATNQPQPITTAPVVKFHPSQSGVMVDFGTGQYLGMPDLVNTDVQTMYGVWDRMESTGITTINRSKLKQQKFLYYSKTQFANGNQGRASSQYIFNWYQGNGLPANPSTVGYMGWYLDLDGALTGEPGERVVFKPLIRGNRLVFNSTIPDANPCAIGGSSWLNEINFATGARLDISPFDYNGDGAINGNDLIDIGGGKFVAGTSIRVVGDPNQPGGNKIGGVTVLLMPGGKSEVKISATTSGKIVKFDESVPKNTMGRRSWYQFKLQ